MHFYLYYETSTFLSPHGANTDGHHGNKHHHAPIEKRKFVFHKIKSF